MDDKKIVELTKYINSLFVWWDDSSCSVAKVMRMPWSLHYKNMYNWKNEQEPFKTEIFQFSMETKDLINEYDKKNLFHLQERNVEIALKYIYNWREESKQWNKIQTWYDEEDKVSIYKIKMPDLLKKLQKYPKVYKWKKYRFFINSDYSIDEEVDWVRVRTDWYKYRIDQDYINCFSDTYHPPEERPRWPIWAFVYYYFDKDIKKINDFFRDEYDIVLSNKKWEWHKELMSITKDEYTISFTKSKVIITYTYETSKWSHFKNVEAISIWLMPIGKYKVEHENTLETEYKFVFDHNWEKIVLSREVSKRDFNKANMVFWYADDNLMWKFFEMLTESPKIKEIEVVQNNWYHNWWVYLWWQAIIDPSVKTENIIPYTYTLFEHWTQTSVKTYLEMMCEVWKPVVTVPALLQTIAMAGMNLRKKQIIYPSLLIAWETGCWKSWMKDCLAKMVWYDMWARRRPLPGISRQPLYQHAWDFSILFCEELTKEVSSRTEEAIRNIINRETWERWLISGKNQAYKLRSPVFTVWERTYKDESLNNRAVAIVLNKMYRAEESSNEKVFRLNQYSCTNEIYKKLSHQWPDLNNYYSDAKKILERTWKAWRMVDTWSYVFAINNIFKLVEESDLIWYMEDNISNMWLNKKAAPKKNALLSLLISWMMKKEIKWQFNRSWLDFSSEFFFANDFYERNRADIHLLEKHYGDLWWIIYVDSTMISIAWSLSNWTFGADMDFIMWSLSRLCWKYEFPSNYHSADF